MYHGKRYGMRVQSEEGKGTTIRLVLPRDPEKHAGSGETNTKVQIENR